MRLEDVAYLILASVLARVANRVAQLCFSHENLDGFPRWRWQLALFGQGLVFPALLLLALRRGCPAGACATFEEWLLLPASALQGFESWYVYCLVASQTRDMFPMPKKASTTMKVHHWLVVIACLLALVAPVGFGLYVLGTFVLEVGSLTFNIWVLYPKAAATMALYQVTMLASNLVATAGGVYLLFMPGLPIPLKILYVAADVGVCIGRQRHALKAAGLIKSKHHKEADAKEPDVQEADADAKEPSGDASAARRRGEGAKGAASVGGS